MFLIIYLQINNNGILSFNNSFHGYLPEDFPLPSNRSIIAPFWADSDTASSGTVWFGIRSVDFNILEKARQDVRRYFSSQHNFDPNFLLVSTWERVPHYWVGNKVSIRKKLLQIESGFSHIQSVKKFNHHNYNKLMKIIFNSTH